MGRLPASFHDELLTEHGEQSKVIPLANLDEPDEKEREQSEKEGETGQEAPPGEHRCH
jgi:hypothetical protein